MVPHTAFISPSSHTLMITSWYPMFTSPSPSMSTPVVKSSQQNLTNSPLSVSLTLSSPCNLGMLLLKVTLLLYVSPVTGSMTLPSLLHLGDPAGLLISILTPEQLS